MKRARTDLIVVHCSATPPDMDIGADTIDRWHKARGWSSIGYHYVVRRNGVADVGRPHDETGAHCKGHNHNSVAVCWVGGVDNAGNPQDNRTIKQKYGLLGIIAMLRELYPQAVVVGHRNLSKDVDGDGVVEEWEWVKACPSFDAMGEYNSEED